jgi:hypothetical protein
MAGERQLTRNFSAFLGCSPGLPQAHKNALNTKTKTSDKVDNGKKNFFS